MEKIKLSVEKESKEVEMEFVEIPGKNIAMLKTELTQAMYGAVMKEYPCMFPGASSPIESISWYDAIYFCNKLSVMKGKEPVYAVNDEKDITKWNYTPHEDERVKGHITQDSHASGFRLPTLEEQQYAAKGGENCKTPGPDDVERVVYDGVTHPVGEGKSNGYGLYGLNDAFGEWVWDLYNKDYEGIRCYSNGFNYLYEGACHRNAYERDYDIGFRIVCSSLEQD